MQIDKVELSNKKLKYVFWMILGPAGQNGTSTGDERVKPL